MGKNVSPLWKFMGKGVTRVKLIAVDEVRSQLMKCDRS